MNAMGLLNAKKNQVMADREERIIRLENTYSEAIQAMRPIRQFLAQLVDEGVIRDGFKGKEGTVRIEGLNRKDPNFRYDHDPEYGRRCAHLTIYSYKDNGDHRGSFDLRYTPFNLLHSGGVAVQEFTAHTYGELPQGEGRNRIFRSADEVISFLVEVIAKKQLSEKE